MTQAQDRLIVALDVPDRTTALKWVDRLAGRVGYFKLGLEIFTREGPPLVREIRERGERVFLDLKLHDIPNTVLRAVRSACRMDVQILTVHASGGGAMLSAAREGAENSEGRLLVAAVTALTSLSQDDAKEIGVGEPLSSWVDKLADLALRNGVRGLVSSPIELPILRKKHGEDLVLIVPGIRAQGTDRGDQKRTAGAGQAILSGADFIVMGRPILQAPDPVEFVTRTVEEIHHALKQSAHIA